MLKYLPKKIILKSRILVLGFVILTTLSTWTYLNREDKLISSVSNLKRQNKIADKMGSTNHRNKVHRGGDGMVDRFEQRYKLLHRNCRTETYLNKDTFGRNQNIIVNEKHRLAVCVVPKSGSSSWHYLMWRIRMNDTGVSVVDSQYTSRDTLVNQFSTYNIKNQTMFARWRPGVDDNFYNRPPHDTIHRIILARHPFARLISAWNQKMLTSHDTASGFLNSYPEMKEYKNYTADSKHAISWEDFATYVSDIRPRKLKINYHFVPAMELCGKCEHPYTYVIKLETVEEDFRWLAPRINITLPLGHVGRSSTGSPLNKNSYDVIKQYMKRLPSIVILNLYKLYHDDFSYFGYYFKLDDGEAGSLV